MAAIMTKRGNLDNVVTNEFICDSAADLSKLDPADVTLGSTAIVLDGGLEVYIANSKKEWILLGGSSDEEEEEGGGA